MKSKEEKDFGRRIFWSFLLNREFDFWIVYNLKVMTTLSLQINLIFPQIPILCLFYPQARVECARDTCWYLAWYTQRLSLSLPFVFIASFYIFKESIFFACNRKDYGWIFVCMCEVMKYFCELCQWFFMNAVCIPNSTQHSLFTSFASIHIAITY